MIKEAVYFLPRRVYPCGYKVYSPYDDTYLNVKAKRVFTMRL